MYASIKYTSNQIKKEMISFLYLLKKSVGQMQNLLSRPIIWNKAGHRLKVFICEINKYWNDNEM